MDDGQKHKQEAPGSKGLQYSSRSPVLDDDDQKEKRESPESKGSQDSTSSVLTEADEYSELPGAEYEFDCDCGCNDDDDQRIEDIVVSMRAIPLRPKNFNSHQRSEAVGHNGSPKSPDLRKHKGIPASPPKPPDSKQKGISISHEMDPLDRLFGRRTWLRPRPHERGEASWSVCVICGERQPTGKMKRLPQCGHLFCEDCMRAYVATRVEKNDQKAKCPHKRCQKMLSDWEQYCGGSSSSYLPSEVADRWSEAVCEATALGNPRYIECPFQDCSAVFMDDGKGYLIRACPKCWRISCINCRVGWHMGLSCYEFLGPRRALMMKIATREKFGESALGLW